MKKRICTLLSFIAMMFLMTSISTFAANGDEFTEGNWSYEVIDEAKKTVSIKPINKTQVTGDVTIPGSVNKGGATYSVTSIGWGAFSDCKGLTNISIPGGVTSIEGWAFSGCKGLTYIIIPYSVTSINSGAFYDSGGLTKFVVSTSNENYCEVDGVLFSKDKKTLVRYPAGKKGTTYTIPDGVTHIGKYAFQYCKSLTSVTIPDSVEKIDRWVFSYCEGLKTVFYKDGLDVSDTEIPETATKIAYKVTNADSTPIEITPTRVTLGKGVNDIKVCSHMVSPHYTLVAPTKAVYGITVDNTWTDATCVSPKTCSVCRKTEGSALGHKWNDATCESPKTCSVCHQTEGFELGHKWNDATCESPKTCSVCGKTEGPALGHNWNPSTGKCNTCGNTCTHDWHCAICGAEKTNVDAVNPNSPASLHAEIENMSGQNLKLIVENPNGVLPEGTQLFVKRVAPGTERHKELIEMRDPTHEAENIAFLEITLLDKDGNALPMPLKDKVHVLLEIPNGFDKDEMQVVLVGNGADVEFDETAVTIDGVDYIGFWSNHFSPYAFRNIAHNSLATFTWYRF